MKHSKIGVLALALVITLVIIPCMMAQVKKDAESGLDRISGTIQSIDKDTSTITVRQTNQSITWKVVFSKDTKFTFQNAAATVAELKDGRRVICLGKTDEKSRLIASRIDVRTEK